MDDGPRRRRRTQTQEAVVPAESSPRLGRNAGSSAIIPDEAPYLSPSGRPMRQRSTANLRNTTPPSNPTSRPIRSSASRGAKVETSASSPFERESDEEEEYVEEEGEEEMPSRTRRTSTRARQPPPPPPSAPVPAPAQSQRVSTSSITTSSPFKVTLGSRSRGAPRSSKRARLAEEENAGWMAEAENDEEAQLVYSTIVAKIQSWMSSNNDSRLNDFMENVPTGTNFETPMTLKMIIEKIGRSEYTSTIDFEKDVLQIFFNGRRYFEPGSEAYGGVLALQRMYQHMTQSTETAKGDIDDDVTAKNFASLRYGPCEDQGEGQGEAVCLGEKVVTPFLRYKGQGIYVGNFVHLSNPTDPSRPIIAQVFKTRTEDLGDGKQDWITACWFLRPEQTKHPRSMLFWPDEALKTSQFVEHHVEDVLEMICVMYYTKYMKGRPAEGEGGWREGDPLYVCENRFHAEKEQFYKIKNWIGVMPEEVKNKQFEMVEFDQPMSQPTKLKSPFLLGSNGPGGIADESYRPPIAAPSLIRSNSSFMGSGVASPSAGSGVGGGGGGGSGLGSIPRIPSRLHAPSTDNLPTAAGATTSAVKIPQLFKEWSDDVQAQRRAYLKAREGERIGLGDASGVAGGAGQTAALTPLSLGGSGEKMPPIAQVIDRSVGNTMLQMDVPAYYKTLPLPTQQLFHQDAESGNVLWYPAPPFLSPSEAKTQKQWNNGNQLPIHSLDYLYHMATKTGTKKRKA